MAYKTPEALGMAVKNAAKASPMDTNKAISSFYSDRLLCRIFSNPSASFLLKGGQSILARTIDARMTRDVDLLAEEMSLDNALKELKRLASVDLNDFITFEFLEAKPIKAEDEYRSGLNVLFNVYLGNKKVQPISIDLVVDDIPQESFDVISPVDRITLPDIPVFDYKVYVAESALADKFCAIRETHNGRASSRTKDLIDIVVYANKEKVDANALLRRLQIECSARHLAIPKEFAVPQEWYEVLAGSFTKSARTTKAAEQYQRLEDAEHLAQKLFNPILSGAAEGKTWNCHTMEWE